MLITAIEKCKGSTCALYVDSELAMTLDAEIVFSNKLKAGVELDHDVLFELKYQSDLRRTRERALYLLESRSHTRKELVDKLVKNSDEEIAEQIADRMEELGLLNDADYAERYARQLVNSKGYGMDRVRRQLAQKGIDRELIDEQIAALSETVDVDEKLTTLIQRKYERYLGDKKGEDKTISALIRLGYRYDDIRRALAAFRE